MRTPLGGLATLVTGIPRCGNISPQNFPPCINVSFPWISFLATKTRETSDLRKPWKTKTRLDVIPKIVFLLFLHGMSGRQDVVSFYFLGWLRNTGVFVACCYMCVFRLSTLNTFAGRMMIRHYSGGRTVSRRVGES